MTLAPGQCLVFPEKEASELLTLCVEDIGSPSIQNAVALAQKCANTDAEDYYVVQVVRKVNYQGDGR